MGLQSSRPLRIAIVAHGLRVAGGVSVGQNMIAAFGRAGGQHKYLFTIPVGLGYEEVCGRIQDHQVVPYGHKGGALRRWVFENLRLPKIIRQFGPDVLLGLGGSGLSHPPCPQVLFPQDAHLFYPTRQFGDVRFSYKLRKAYRRRCLVKQLKNTEAVLCQTEVVEERIRHTLGYGGRILVCPSPVSKFILENGVDEAPPEELAPYRDKFKLLCVAKYYTHKNLEGIVDVFHKYRGELDDVVVFLTVDAQPGGGGRELVRRIARLGVDDRIINIGPIPHSLVGSYYRHADALLMPTMLETFCLPFLEAMQFGLPILTSDLDFARAVCGDAALYLDPWNAGSMKDAILRLKNDRDMRMQLVAHGTDRLATAFASWDEVGGEVIKLLSEIGGA